jgi:AraC family transcriptional regulator
MATSREETASLPVFLSRMPPQGQSVVASSAAIGWESIHAVVLEGRVEEFFDFSAPSPVVLFVLKGAAQLDWRRGNRYSRLGVKAGEVLIAPPSDSSRMRTNRPIEVLWCLIGLDLLEEVAERGWGPHCPEFEVVEGFNRIDEELWNLGRRLAARLVAPIPGSRVDAEALLTQIALHVLWNYSTLDRPGEPHAGPLADRRVRDVIDYIRRTLADDLSLDTLAGVAGLSPNYFLGAFKQATGRTPHQYVIEQRVAKACELLHDPHRPITDVSLAVGFSSQSHLTEAFRRFMKTTPAAYRKDVLGLSRNGDEPPD